MVEAAGLGCSSLWWVLGIKWKRGNHQITLWSWAAMVRHYLFHPGTSARISFFNFQFFQISISITNILSKLQTSFAGRWIAGGFAGAGWGPTHLLAAGQVGPGRWICSQVPASLSASEKYFHIFVKGGLPLRVGVGLKCSLAGGKGEQ